MSLESEYQDAVGEGVMVMNVIIEDENYEEADLADLEAWSGEYGLTMPVVSDPGGAYMWTYLGGGGSVNLPFMVLLLRGEVVDTVGTATVDDAVRMAGLAE